MYNYFIGEDVNFTAGMDGCPTLTELMNFGENHVDVIERIGDKYYKFGTLLLEDETGSKMGVIQHDERTAVAINNRVLTRWIRGEGRKPTSWTTLATVLEECGLTLLAEEIHSVKVNASQQHPPT